MTDASQLPPDNVIVRYRVADFDDWKAVFDDNESHRKAAGFLAHHITRDEDDPNSISVFFAVSDEDQFKAYASSDEVKALMAEAGVVSEPTIGFITQPRQGALWDRQLPVARIKLHVEDFDHWSTAFDAGDELRSANGITGRSVNRSQEDPSTVVVYLQAESVDTLRAFMALDELRTAMKEAGVSSDPEVSYHTGGWGKLY
ncbi:MAG: antibiotic biosynthesis monooxygenase [Acidimicrobiia bacterium]|nr:antibiotic biosynthesis monooxygenase [Acidimicrobiia bacterium]